MDLDELYKSTMAYFEYDGEELGYAVTNKLETVFHIPLDDPLCDKVTIFELLCENGDRKVNDFVTLVAIVVSVSLVFDQLWRRVSMLDWSSFQVGPVKNYTSKEGKSRNSMDVKLMDSTARDKFISLVLWDSVLQKFAEQWVPRSTGRSSSVVFILAILLRRYLAIQSFT